MPTTDHLTNRQRQCLSRYARGQTQAHIALELGISQPTVSGHIRRALGPSATCHRECLMDPAKMDRLGPAELIAW